MIQEDIKKVLIVEDQRWPIESLEEAMNQVLPNSTYDLAKCYSTAKSLIENPDNKYDMVLLDHRMPYEETGDLQVKNFDKFQKKLRNIGYNLISKIKEINQNTIVIGTSTLEQDEINITPDYRMGKMLGDGPAELRGVLKKINQENNTYKN